MQLREIQQFKICPMCLKAKCVCQAEALLKNEIARKYKCAKSALKIAKFYHQNKTAVINSHLTKEMLVCVKKFRQMIKELRFQLKLIELEKQAI